ncbi:MAG: hypothetical protein Q9162_007624 [Coniocarpon cinnabarinum]
MYNPLLLTSGGGNIQEISNGKASTKSALNFQEETPSGTQGNPVAIPDNDSDGDLDEESLPPVNELLSPAHSLGTTNPAKSMITKGCPEIDNSSKDYSLTPQEVCSTRPAHLTQGIEDEVPIQNLCQHKGYPDIDMVFPENESNRVTTKALSSLNACKDIETSDSESSGSDDSRSSYYNTDETSSYVSNSDDEDLQGRGVAKTTGRELSRGAPRNSYPSPTPKSSTLSDTFENECKPQIVSCVLDSTSPNTAEIKITLNIGALLSTQEPQPTKSRLVMTSSSTYPSTSPDSISSKVKWSRYTKEENQQLINLREKEKLSFHEISKYFPGRTKSSLQVRYHQLTRSKPTTSKKTR